MQNNCSRKLNNERKEEDVSKTFCPFNIENILFTNKKNVTTSSSLHRTPLHRSSTSIHLENKDEFEALTDTKKYFETTKEIYEDCKNSHENVLPVEALCCGDNDECAINMAEFDGEAEKPTITASQFENSSNGIDRYSCYNSFFPVRFPYPRRSEIQENVILGNRKPTACDNYCFGTENISAAAAPSFDFLSRISGETPILSQLYAYQNACALLQSRIRSDFLFNSVPSLLSADQGNNNFEKRLSSIYVPTEHSRASDHFYQNGSDVRSRPRKARTVFNDSQLKGLELEFREHRYLSSSQRGKVAKSLDLSETQVKTWFQNRRMKAKKQVSSAPSSGNSYPIIYSDNSA